MPSTFLEDTIVEDEEATSLPEEEAAPDETVETEVEETNPYAGKTPAEIQALIDEAAKSAEARARKSEQDRIAAAQAELDRKREFEAYQRDQQVAVQVVNGSAKNQIRDAVSTLMKQAAETAAEGGEVPEPDPQWLDAVVTNYRIGLRNLDAGEWANVANKWLTANHSDYNPPAELINRAGQALGRYDHAAYMETLLAIAEQAGEAKGIVKGKELAEEDNRVKSLESKNGKQPGPSGSSNGAPPSRNLEQQLEEATTMADRRAAWKALYPDVPFPARA